MSRMSSIAVVSVFCLSILFTGTPASAQGESQNAAPAPTDPPLNAKLYEFQLFALGERPRASRPAILPLLYVSLAGFEAYDGYSTSTGTARGAVEGNPFLRVAVQNPVAWWAVKGGSAALSIYMAERLWKSNRRGQAVVVMVAANALLAAVAANNASIIRAQRGAK